MKKVKIQKAIGMVLGHDLTRIVPGSFKGVAFKKGHILREEDIPALLDIGKETIFVMEIPPGRLHENDAAGRLAQALKGDLLTLIGPSEGKISLAAQTSGLLKIKVNDLARINLIPNIIVSTLHNNSLCLEGDTAAATRIIPLTIDEKSIARAETICSRSGPVVSLKPLSKKKVGVVVTGSEFYKGRVQDGFEDWVGKKLLAFECTIIRKEIVPDQVSRIAGSIKALIESGCDLIITTGGMSIDPDDVTRKGIRRAGARIIFFGTPVLPGAMFLYARLGEIPLLGLPACVFYHKVTLFDLILPLILAGEEPTRKEIALMGHGGLCRNCNECRFPVCPFGK
ncbi:MAG: molybdopterin-binding protein [Deltaproteobacteria bacterium]|nr:molybdopterin-binding protein [Deltaproteobacteria bacterium]